MDQVLRESCAAAEIEHHRRQRGHRIGLDMQRHQMSMKPLGETARNSISTAHHIVAAKRRQNRFTVTIFSFLAIGQ